MLAAALGVVFRLPSVWFSALLLLPLLLDGFAQLLSKYETTNLRRVVTGVLFGYGFLSLLVLSWIAAYRFGYRLTH